MKSIYLCGPIGGCSYKECTDWRKYVANNIGEDILALSPMRAKEYLSNETNIKLSYETTILSSAVSITARDRNDIMNCDLLFVNLLAATKITIGSMIELGWADAWRKPIVLIMEPDNIHNHPIVNSLAGFRASTLDEGIFITKAILSSDLARKFQ
jgi:nucleoside 2-deoxyribosyltransferase